MIHTLNHETIAFPTTTERELSNKKSIVRVLYVDDDISLLEVSKQILSLENNFEIDTATCVDEAFEKMEHQDFDAIVSDYEMPQKNGLDFLKELRSQGKDVPFILFTGKGREEVVVKALNLGADRYINKHGSPQTVYCELADAINKTIEQKKSKQLLVQSESKYRTLVEKSLQGILIAQTSPLRIVFANIAMNNLLGYSVDELKSLSPSEVAGLIYDDDKVVFFSRLEKRIHEEPASDSLEFRAVRKNGSLIWLEGFANRIEYMGEPAVQGLFLDINERKNAQINLSESEERYRNLANSLPDIVFEADANGQIIFANKKAFDIAGCTPEDLEKGLNVLQFIVPEERETAKKNIEKLFAEGSCLPTEYTFMRKNGTTFPTLVTATIHISRNTIKSLRGLAIDITERKKAEERLRESEKTHRSLFSSMKEGFCFHELIYDSNGRPIDYTLLDANPAYELILGLKKEKVIGKKASAVYGSNEAPYLEIYAKVAITQEPASFETYFPPLRKNFSISAFSPSKDHFATVFTDITEQKKSREELQKNALILQNSSDAIIVTDLTGKITFWNKGASEIFGYNGQEIIGEYLTKLLTFSDREQIGSEMLEQLRTGKTSVGEWAGCRKDGSTVWLILNTILLKNSKNEPIGLVGFGKDITERKKTEAALADSVAKYRALVENAEDAIVLTDLTGKPIYLNPAYYKGLGYEVNEQLEMSAFARVHPDDVPSIKEQLHRLLKTGSESSEYRVKHNDGTWNYRSAKSTVIYNSKHQPYAILVIIRDITKEKKIEKALMESETDYRNLINGMAESTWVIDLNKNFIDVNDSALQMLGYSKQELLSLGIEGIDNYLSQEDLKNLIGELFIKGRKVFETVHTAKDGTQIPVEISSSLITYRGKQAVLSIARNITERKEAEKSSKENTEKLAAMNEKLRVIGSLTRHDVGNKLTVIKSSLYLLKKHPNDKSLVAQNISRIELALVASDRLIEFSRLYEQLGAEKPLNVNVFDCFNQATTLFPSLSNIKIINECKGLVVQADSLLKQLFYNLIDNSIKHGEKVTQIKLCYTKENDKVSLSYEDDGVGVSVANKAKLFDAGFTTGNGTGLGLNLIKKMLDIYGWQIRETGESNKGVRFIITIPKLTESKVGKYL